MCGSLNGELYTQKMAQKFHADKRSTASTEIPRHTGCRIVRGGSAAWQDCSGGIIGAIRTVHSYIDKSANTFFQRMHRMGRGGHDTRNRRTVRVAGWSRYMAATCLSFAAQSMARCGHGLKRSPIGGCDIDYGGGGGRSEGHHKEPIL